ncbi:MAG: TIGR01777 family oxidoreductase [Calditrichaeota bacterium]|nr:TIGR01777 family oxidoreductase [Calditrichota bacterium]MCB9368962.1 TIGR01777 family protein [Calditrichota bacterium]
MRIGALERLTPSWSAIRVTWGDEHVREGSRRELVVPAGPLKIKWLAKHHSIIAGRQFIDEQERGPFRKWSHLHLCTDIGAGRSELEDRIDYDFPLGRLGGIFGRSQVQWMLRTVFPWRHERTWMDLSRHAEFADRPRLKVAISGASGLIGKSLKEFLQTGGHSVWTLDRKKSQRTESIYWNPRTGEIEAEKLEGLDAVVHLAGRSIADGRWTESVKQQILDSRVQGTTLIAETISRLKTPPKVLISASAMGIYADSDGPVSEDGALGSTFTADVVKAWESSADAARKAGIRVVHPRISLVLSGWGGSLGRLLPVFRWGLGGKLGHGRQMMSWIHLDDLTAAIYRMIYDESLAGPVNCSTGAVSNQEFTKTLGHVLGRPTLFSVPELAIKTGFGQMGQELLLSSLNMRAEVLEKSGFRPWLSDLESAFRFETGKPHRHQPPFHPVSLPQSGQNGYLIS